MVRAPAWGVGRSGAVPAGAHVPALRSNIRGWGRPGRVVRKAG